MKTSTYFLVGNTKIVRVLSEVLRKPCDHSTFEWTDSRRDHVHIDGRPWSFGSSGYKQSCTTFGSWVFPAKMPKSQLNRTFPVFHQIHLRNHLYHHIVYERTKTGRYHMSRACGRSAPGIFMLSEQNLKFQSIWSGWILKSIHPRHRPCRSSEYQEMLVELDSE